MQREAGFLQSTLSLHIPASPIASFVFIPPAQRRRNVPKAHRLKKQKPAVTLHVLHNQHNVPAYLKEQLRQKAFRCFCTEEERDNQLRKNLMWLFQQTCHQRFLLLSPKKGQGWRRVFQRGILKIFIIIRPVMRKQESCLDSKYIWCFT